MSKNSKRDLRFDRPSQDARMLVDRQSNMGLLVQVGIRRTVRDKDAPERDPQSDDAFEWNFIRITPTQARKLRELLAGCAR